MASARGTFRQRARRMAERATSSRAGTFYFSRIANPVDQRLVPATNGFLSMAPGQPVLVIETVGARSGSVRRTPVLYVTDGDDFVLTASNGGAPRHPGWYFNLRARPDGVQVYVRGRSGRYRARFPDGPEYDRLWERVNEVYSGYGRYQQKAGSSRKIPLVVLSRSASS